MFHSEEQLPSKLSDIISSIKNNNINFESEIQSLLFDLINRIKLQNSLFKIDYKFFWSWAKGLKSDKLITLEQIYHSFQLFYISFCFLDLETITLKSFYYSYLNNFCERPRNSSYDLDCIRSKAQVNSIALKLDSIFNYTAAALEFDIIEDLIKNPSMRSELYVPIPA